MRSVGVTLGLLTFVVGFLDKGFFFGEGGGGPSSRACHACALDSRIMFSFFDFFRAQPSFCVIAEKEATPRCL